MLNQSLCQIEYADGADLDFKLHFNCREENWRKYVDNLSRILDGLIEGNQQPHHDTFKIPPRCGLYYRLKILKSGLCVITVCSCRYNLDGEETSFLVNKRNNNLTFIRNKIKTIVELCSGEFTEKDNELRSKYADDMEAFGKIIEELEEEAEEVEEV